MIQSKYQMSPELRHAIDTHSMTPEQHAELMELEERRIKNSTRVVLPLGGYALYDDEGNMIMQTKGIISKRDKSVPSKSNTYRPSDVEFKVIPLRQIQLANVPSKSNTYRPSDVEFKVIPLRQIQLANVPSPLSKPKTRKQKYSKKKTQHKRRTTKSRIRKQ
jgi:hypothetical protein